MTPDPTVRTLVLVGLMGAGKTTVGGLLAARLGWPLRDSDAEIEAATGRTVRELRDELGVDPMHDLEARQLLDALAAPGPAVVTPAASVVEVEACRQALRRPGIAVAYLTVRPGVGAARFAAGEHRPWYGADPATFLAEQAAVRDPLFRSLEPMVVATDDLRPHEVADAVVAALAGRPIEG